MSMPSVPLSWGELIDKLTILRIKAARLEGEALTHVRRELDLLEKIAAPVLAGAVAELVLVLAKINESLWEIEDRIRAKEAAASFDAEFVALARAVYHSNDERGAVKRRISQALGSALEEQKQYTPYK
jgi:hypothetical protein